jgi:acetyltransferase-like isoleucine patch superfamily enzyme
MIKKELIIRFIQHLFSPFLFDIPVFSNIKMGILKIFFKIGKSSYVSYRTILFSPHNSLKSHFEMGNYVGIEHDCDIDYSGGLIIRDNVWISEKVIITTHNHTVIKPIPKNQQGIVFSGLIIEDDSWIGAGAIILSSVKRIGKGAVVGAGAVVRTDVNDFEIVMGNPAQLVGKRFKY